VDKGWLTAFLEKNSLLKKAQELRDLSRNQLRIMIGLLTGHYHLKGHIFKLGMVDSPRRDRFK
jgi:hypothetical protein